MGIVCYPANSTTLPWFPTTVRICLLDCTKYRRVAQVYQMTVFREQESIEFQ